MLKWFKSGNKSPKVVNKNKRNQASRKVQKEAININIDRRYVLIILALSALAILIAQVPRDQWLPIEKISIAGEFRQLDTEKLQQQLKPYLGEGFFSVDIQKMQNMVSQQPWISNVSVRRVWPSQIMVSVEEKHAFARWDESHLLSTRAQIFKADTSQFESLPLINGYKGQSAELLKHYLRLQQQFADHGIQVSELREDSKGALSLLLNDQLKVNLGSINNEQKILHMLAVYPLQIKPRTEHIRHIDFRYSNGFAIAWKKDYAEQLDSAKKLSSQQLRSNRNV